MVPDQCQRSLIVRPHWCWSLGLHPQITPQLAMPQRFLGRCRSCHAAVSMPAAGAYRAPTIAALPRPLGAVTVMQAPTAAAALDVAAAIPMPVSTLAAYTTAHAASGSVAAPASCSSCLLRLGLHRALLLLEHVFDVFLRGICTLHDLL
jgi:hypothetical protein